MEGGIFNTRVSLYRSVRDREGVVVPLSSFLFSTRHKGEIMRIRAEKDHAVRNEMKKNLPQCTPSGVFAPTRAADNLVSHSGFICIDIDEADNPQLYSMAQVRDILADRPEVAFASLSVSGRGYFALIPLRFPHQHKAQFDALREEYGSFGVNIDIHCSDVSRMRCVSYDDNPYVNPDARAYASLAAPELSIRPVRGGGDGWGLPTAGRGSAAGAVEKCVRMIEDNRLDMTSSYDAWISLGSSLAALGEEGRLFFHRISQFYPEYDPKKTDRKFDSLLKRRDNSIGTFFNICRDYGVTFKENH